MLLPTIFKIGMQKMTLESDKRLAEMEMKAKLGQLIYLESLTKVSNESIQIQIFTIMSSTAYWGIRYWKFYSFFFGGGFVEGDGRNMQYYYFEPFPRTKNQSLYQQWWKLQISMTKM